MKALVVAPYEINDPLQSSSIAARTTIPILEHNGFQVTTLEDAHAVRPEFEKVLMADDYDLIAFFGHGHEDSWIADKPERKRISDDPLLDIENISLVEGAFVVAIACFSGEYLGSVAVTVGRAQGFVGFEDLVYLPLAVEDRNYEADFLRTFVTLFLSLAHGYTLHQTKTEFEKSCSKYEMLYEDEQPEFYKIVRAYMAANRDGVVYYGNPNANMGRGIIECNITS